MALTVPRCVVRQFRAVLRKLVPPRSPWPFVLIQGGPEGLILQARGTNAGVEHHVAGKYPAEAIQVSGEVLARFEGKDDTPVLLETVSFGKGKACWQAVGAAQECELATVVPEMRPPFPELREPLSPLPLGSLDALAEAVRTASHDTARFALSCLLLRGKKGEVVATDGRQLLIQGGFTFPWDENLLVPALPVFASKELPSHAPGSIGRTDSEVGLKIGPWTIWLRIDKDSRYPNIDQLVPETKKATSVLHIAAEDVPFLAEVLRSLPGKDEPLAPVTLDLGKVALRAKEEGETEVIEVALPRSRVSGPPVAVAMDRRYLQRALQLGFAAVRVGASTRPVVCQDGNRTYLWMPLDKNGVVPATSKARRAESKPSPSLPAPATPPTERKSDMANPQGSPAPARNGATDSVPSSERAATLEDLIQEGEALRASLHDAQVRMGRLVAALKHQRRQTQAVAAAMASLRQLQQLGP